MALTLATANRLDDVGLVEFYERDSQIWIDLAKMHYDFIRRVFPSGAKIRRDDLAKELVPAIEVNEGLRSFMKEEKIRGKFWIPFFADLVVDRAWDRIVRELGVG
ncbi:hypothetical protein [Rhodopila sp.]|uniref:hypothetical protein n=1 Tax=Rhodopila sp. TaxID=2480087 RepID=UPI003D0B732C